MPRIRNIKPEFFLHEHLTVLSPLTRILFVGLWCLADKEGRLKDRPKTIKVQVLPFDKHNIDQALNDLVKIGCISRYTKQGEGFIQITNWEKHQRPHHTERDSVLPPLKDGEVTVTLQVGKEKGKEKGKENIKPGADFPFYQDFGGRNGMRGSKKKAMEYWKKMTPEEQRAAMEALEKQKRNYATCKANNIFVAEFPDAWRWLRDRRWEDSLLELTKPKRPPEKPKTKEEIEWDRRYNQQLKERQKK